jgi:hypothetical protein
MKLNLILLAVFVAVGAHAQTNKTDHVARGVIPKGGSIELATTTPEHKLEIKGPRVSYSGIAVQAAKADNPLQLINPFAPAEYGSGAANVSPGTPNGRGAGLKLLSVKF